MCEKKGVRKRGERKGKGRTIGEGGKVKEQ
jgi:hypothetical protein